MGGSTVQIVATGPQNVILNSNPEGTLFKGFYRRITMFAIESIQTTFVGTTDFGNKVSTIIGKNGDLISKILLEITLPSISVQVSGGIPTDDIIHLEYVDNIGHHILKEIEFEVGGVSITKHYGKWLHIWQELTRNKEQDNTYYKMTGNHSLRTDLFTQAVYTNTNQVLTLTPSNKLYVPLKFWFCNNYALAFPLISLSYFDVKLHIKFSSLSEITNAYIEQVALSDGGTISNVTANNELDVKMFVDYIFLDNDERRNFATSAHEYLIHELQYLPAESHQGQVSIKRNLDGYNHPIKEMIWVVQRDDYLRNGPNKNLNDFTNAGAQMVNSAKLQINGNDRFTARDGNYFNWVQPNQHHTRGPENGIYVYSFATEPELEQSTGTCNFSKIDKADLLMNLSYISPSKSHVYMINYNVIRFMSGMCGKAFSS
jgi:hypothetical protein